MRRRLRPASNDHGFSLIELLVVVLIIGILAAIAIPVFLGQKSKAVDSTGREMARSAAGAAETYSTDHNGEYAGLNAEALHSYEHQVQIEEGNNSSWITVAEPIESNKGYKVTAQTPIGDTFTWTKSGSGVVTRTCTVKAGGNKGGCPSGSW